MEVLVLADGQPKGVRVVEHGATRVSEIPGEAVQVAEDVAARARRLAVARGEGGVVEELASVRHRGGLRVVDRQVLDLVARARGRVDDGYRVVEACEDVEPPSRLVEDEAARAAAAQQDVARETRRERIGLQLRGSKHAHLAAGSRACRIARAEGRHVERAAVAGHRHAERCREARVGRAGGAGDRAVAVRAAVEMLVQMPRRDAAAHGIEDGDARLTQMADHGRRAAARRALPLEAHVVARVAVGHVHVAVRGVDDHVEEDGADVGEGLAIVRRARDGARRVLSGVDAKDVVVGQGEGNGIVPVAAERVDPVRAVEREDQAGLGAGHTIRVLVRRREAARVRDAVHGARPGAGATVADGPLVDRGRLVAGVKDGRVDGVAIAAHRERARRVAEEGDDR